MSTLTLIPTNGLPGAKVAFSGKGFPVHVQVLISFGPTNVASVTSDLHGAIAGSFVVPNLAKAGTMIVRTAVASSAAAKFTVVAPKPTAGDLITFQ